MDKEFESIIKKVREIKLKDDERSTMRAFLFKNLTSSKTEQDQNVTKLKTNRLYYYYQFIKNYYFMINKNKFVPTLIIALVIAATGGTAAFAEKAVPGDLLYAIKTSVNEPVAGIFTLTKEEKTEWQERLVERRLEEAQKLASKGDLNETTRISLETEIKSKINEFNINVNELALQKNQDITSSDLNIRLQASLKAYQNVLENLSKKTDIDENTKQETEKLLAALIEYNGKVKDDHKNLESNVGVDSENSVTTSTTPSDNSALGKQNAAANILNSTKLAYQREKVNLSVNIQSQIDTKLALAETALEEGNIAMTSSDFVKATEKFQLVISSANEAKLLMLSNVIKGDIEDDMGIENDSGDIEENEPAEHVDENKNKDNLNLSGTESIKIKSGDSENSEED
jgi:hypothetical protein